MASIDGNEGAGAIDLGIINSEVQNKDSGLFQTPLPGSDSDKSILLDVFGTFRTITITGTYQGIIAEQRTFIDAIETICDGSQVSSTFVSSIKSETRNVYIQTFNWEVVEATPGKITYVLTLLEGANVTS